MPAADIVDLEPGLLRAVAASTCSTTSLVTSHLDRTADGQVVFPYDAAHVDFTVGVRA